MSCRRRYAVATAAATKAWIAGEEPRERTRVLVRPGRLRLVLQAGSPIAGRDLAPPRLDGLPAPAVDAEMPEPLGTPTCCLPAPAISSSRT